MRSTVGFRETPSKCSHSRPKCSSNSRRSLERAFRAELRRTMLHEILRVRINHAQKLLETTALSVTDIAAQSGFANLNHFFRVFHGRTGLTPRAFRLARKGSLGMEPLRGRGESVSEMKPRVC